MKKGTNILLVYAVIIPIVLLFWPFTEWNDAMSVILRIIPSVAVQVLLCRICKLNLVKAIPIFLTGVLATWGIYLYLTSPHWSNATVGDFIMDYVSPFICCVVTFIICLLIKNKKQAKFQFVE